MVASRLLRKWWLAPLGVGIVGATLSWLAFWGAEKAEDRRIQSVLEFRAEWRARDLEAKIRLSGNAVENIAIGITTNPFLDPGNFSRLAKRARRELGHVNSLQWAPRVPREQIAAFEESARSRGMRDYRMFDVTPDFRPTELADREEYFPVLYDERFHGERRVVGLALGRYAGRGVPMMKARDEGRPVATTPVRPIGAPTAALVYLLFWPVYDSIEVPDTIEERQARLSGFAVGNYDLAALLTEAIRNTPEIIGTIHFSIAAAAPNDREKKTVAMYSPATHGIELITEGTGPVDRPTVRIERDFTVFDQQWHLTFDHSPAAVAALRSSNAWGWLLAGIFLTASLVFYLVREHGRTQAIASLIAIRTAELKQASELLHQAQKMESVGQLTGGVAHDFNNLLTVIIGGLDNAIERASSEIRPSLENSLRAAERGAQLIKQLLAFSRRQALSPERIHFNLLAAGMRDILTRTLGEHIEIETKLSSDLWPVLADKGQVENALLNLTINARDAMPESGKLTIETGNVHLDADYAERNAEVSPGDYAMLAVTDTGTGMPPEVLERAFEPFFTTKDTGKGTGLGLSMIYGFAKQSGGHLKIYSEIGHGTTVRLYLPRAPIDTDAVAAPMPVRSDHPTGGETILVVEDDGDVRAYVVGQLRDLGYNVIEASDGPQAQRILESEMTIDLLFTDVVMPGGMTGRNLAERAKAHRPALRTLFTSGYTENSIIHQGKLDPGVHLLSKPYRRQELARKIREVLEAVP